MKKIIYTSIAFLILGLITSFMFHHNRIIDLSYKFSNQKELYSDLENTIRLFNKIYALFFNTGGETMLLDEFPADNLVKRRIFQDIEIWWRSGKRLVHDLHSIEFVSYNMESPHEAVVITKELWHIWVSEIESRKKEAKEVNPVKIRYYLLNNGERWIVREYEVYEWDDDMPPIKKKIP